MSSLEGLILQRLEELIEGVPLKNLVLAGDTEDTDFLLENVILDNNLHFDLIRSLEHKPVVREISFDFNDSAVSSQHGELLSQQELSNGPDKLISSDLLKGKGDKDRHVQLDVIGLLESEFTRQPTLSHHEYVSERLVDEIDAQDFVDDPELVERAVVSDLS